MSWTTADIDALQQRRTAPRIDTPMPIAKGRLKEPKMNKTEAAYARVLDAEKQAGEVARWWFNAMNLRIGDNCFYQTDFLVLLTSGEMQIRETKGWMRDDALVKLRAIAAQFPFRLFVLKLKKGQWEKTEF